MVFKIQKKIVEIIVLLLWGLSSCGDPVCDDILSKLSNFQCSNGEECIVDMKDLFEENWERLYIFSGFNTPEDISEALGFAYFGNSIYDGTRLILLVRNNKVQKSYKTDCHSLALHRIAKSGYVEIDSSKSKLLLEISGTGEDRQYTFIEQVN